MQRLVIDETLPAKLLALTGTVELVKPDGELMAVVERRYDPAVYSAGPGISEEEIEWRLNHDVRIPGDEVVARLRKLA